MVWYYRDMITSCANAETEKIFRGETSRKLPTTIQVSARRKLLMIDQAVTLGDLAALPGNRFEKLEGDRAGQYSIRINEQWRVCFLWTAENNAESVEIVDYH
jgi:toxin HigB-1